MEKIKKVLKERSNGLLLLTFAVLIIAGISLNSHRAESQNGQNLVSNDQVLEEKRVLGETNDSSDQMVEPNQESDKTQEISVSEAKDEAEVTSEKYDTLKKHLKKYCEKDYDSKQCKKYIAEAKAYKKDKQYNDLYKKYRDKIEERNKDNKDDNNDSNSSVSQTIKTVGNELDFKAGSKEFKIAFSEGETVFDVMKRAKSQGKIDFKYEDYGGGLGVMITEINGVKNGDDADWTQNKYWILYVSGKISPVGCSNHKLNKPDTSIEWKYEKYS